MQGGLDIRQTCIGCRYMLSLRGTFAEIEEKVTSEGLAGMS